MCERRKQSAWKNKEKAKLLEAEFERREMELFRRQAQRLRDEAFSIEAWRRYQALARVRAETYDARLAEISVSAVDESFPF